MKQKLVIALFASAVLLFTGCGGGISGTWDVPVVEFTENYIVFYDHLNDGYKSAEAEYRLAGDTVMVKDKGVWSDYNGMFVFKKGKFFSSGEELTKLKGSGKGIVGKWCYSALEFTKDNSISFYKSNTNETFSGKYKLAGNLILVDIGTGGWQELPGFTFEKTGLFFNGEKLNKAKGKTQKKKEPSKVSTEEQKVPAKQEEPKAPASNVVYEVPADYYNQMLAEGLEVATGTFKGFSKNILTVGNYKLEDPDLKLSPEQVEKLKGKTLRVEYVSLNYENVLKIEIVNSTEEQKAPVSNVVYEVPADYYKQMSSEGLQVATGTFKSFSRNVYPDDGDINRLTVGNNKIEATGLNLSSEQVEKLKGKTLKVEYVSLNWDEVLKIEIMN